MAVAVAVESAPAVIVRLRSQRREDRRTAPPGEAMADEELLHGRIVRHEEIGAVDGERKVPVTDVEGDADRLLAVPRCHRKHGLGPGLDLQVPVGLHRHDIARLKDGAGGQGECHFPPRRRDDAAPRPPALFPREAEGLAPSALEVTPEAGSVITTTRRPPDAWRARDRSPRVTPPRSGIPPRSPCLA